MKKVKTYGRKTFRYIPVQASVLSSDSSDSDESIKENRPLVSRQDEDSPLRPLSSPPKPLQSLSNQPNLPEKETGIIEKSSLKSPKKPITLVQECKQLQTVQVNNVYYDSV